VSATLLKDYPQITQNSRKKAQKTQKKERSEKGCNRTLLLGFSDNGSFVPSLPSSRFLRFLRLFAAISV